jgi:hypothetical protein
MRKIGSTGIDVSFLPFNGVLGLVVEQGSTGEAIAHAKWRAQAVTRARPRCLACHLNLHVL